MNMLDEEIIYDLRSCGLKIGDSVKSKNPDGQVKIEGVIVGLMKADFYVDSVLNNNGRRIPEIDPDIIWGKTNPTWRQQFVAFVFFNFPQRTATKEEWVESGVRQGFYREDCENNYERQCPVTQYMAMPVGDLVLEE